MLGQEVLKGTVADAALRCGRHDNELHYTVDCTSLHSRCVNGLSGLSQCETFLKTNAAAGHFHVAKLLFFWFSKYVVFMKQNNVFRKSLKTTYLGKQRI